MEDHERGAGGVVVGEVGCEEDGDECDEVGWGGEGLGLKGCVAHFLDYGGEEDGEGGEGYVGAEEHCLWMRFSLCNEEVGRWLTAVR